MICFIQAEIVGRIWIGFVPAAKYDRRLKSIKAASPVPVIVLLRLRGGPAKARRIRERFGHANVFGEWFESAPDLVRYIARVQAKGSAPGQRDTSRSVTAAAWLAARFQERPEWTADDLFRAARADGVSRNAIFEAKELLGLPRPRRTLMPDGRVSFIWRNN